MSEERYIFNSFFFFSYRTIFYVIQPILGSDDRLPLFTGFGFVFVNLWFEFSLQNNNQGSGDNNNIFFSGLYAKLRP